MKKIIFISVIFFAFLQMNTTVLASLQQELTILSDKLVALKRALKQKTSINFAELLNEAHETALTQEKNFEDITEYLKKINPKKEIISVYAGIKKKFNTSFKVTNRLRKLVYKLRRLYDDPIFQKSFNEPVMNLYRKIKKDWQNYANEFHNFVEKNKNTDFFEKTIFINDEGQEIENFALKSYVEELDAQISKANASLQSVLEEYIGDLDAKDYIQTSMILAKKKLQSFNVQSNNLLRIFKNIIDKNASQKDLVTLDNIDRTIDSGQYILELFVIFKKYLSESFPNLYKDIHSFLYEINETIKKFNTTLTNFYRQNFDPVTFTQVQYKGNEKRLVSVIDDIKAGLEKWRNDMYNDIVKPIEDELKIKKGNW